MRSHFFLAANVASTSPRYELGKVAFSGMFLKRKKSETDKSIDEIDLSISLIISDDVHQLMKSISSIDEIELMKLTCQFC